MSIAVTQDGKRAVSGSTDRTVRLWDLENNLEARQPMGHSSKVIGVAVTSDGRKALSVSWDGNSRHVQLKEWEPESSREVHAFTSHTREPLEGFKAVVDSVAMVPDGRWVLVSWNAEVLNWSSEFCGPPEMGWIDVIDLTSGTTIRTLEDNERFVRKLKVSMVKPDVRLAVLSLSHNRVTVWDLESGEVMRKLEGFGGNSYAISPNGRFMISGQMNNSCQVFDLDRGGLAHYSSAQNHGKVLAVISDDQVVSRSSDSNLNVWSLETGQIVNTLEIPNRWINAVAISQDRKWFAIASDNETLAVWDLKGMRLCCTFTGESQFTSCAFCADNRTIVAGEESGRVHFLRLILSEDTAIPFPCSPGSAA
jgi:WD40 repeat protein